MNLPYGAHEKSPPPLAMDQTTVDSINGFLESLRADRTENGETFQHILNELVSWSPFYPPPRLSRCRILYK
jgi:hypothetical protein